MSIVQTIKLNLIPNSGPILVKCDQYDVGEGRIVAKLYDGDTAYTPAAGATAIIQGKKPDGNGFMYDATLSGNTVTADLTNQMSVVAGRVCCQIVVTESDNRTGSFVFFLEVQPSALPSDTEMSASDYQVIEELLETAQAINENFPYIGANGHWYYYDIEQGQYVDSGASAGTSISVGTTTTLPQGEDATVTNTGDNINAVFNFGIPRGEKGDDGEPGQDGADGVTPDISATATADALSSATPTVEVTKTGTTAAPSFKFEFSGLKGQQGEQGIQGEIGQTGADGNGIVSITKTGTSGLVDTYTITYTNGTTSTFTVTNGQDGQGAGDMTKAVYDSTNAVANAGGIVSYINGLNFDKYLALYGATALSASDLNDVVNLGTYYKSGSGLKSHSPSDIVTADEYTLIVMGAMASSVATDGDPVIQLMVAHIAATDEAKIYLRGFIGTTGSFVDPYAWTNWVCLNAPDVSGKADKVSSATNGDLAGLDSNGNLTDSGYKPSDFATPSDIPDITGKADKVSGATSGDFAGLDASGNLTDSGYKASDFFTIEDAKDAEIIPSKNVLNNAAITQTLNTVVFTVNSDKSVSLGNNTASANTFFFSDEYTTLPAGTYVLSGCPENGDYYNSYDLRLVKSNDSEVATDSGSSTQFTLSEDTTFRYLIRVKSGQSTNGLVFYPMVCTLADWNKSHEYEPYYVPVKDRPTYVKIAEAAENQTWATQLGIMNTAFATLTTEEQNNAYLSMGEDFNDGKLAPVVRATRCFFQVAMFNTGESLIRFIRLVSSKITEVKYPIGGTPSVTDISNTNNTLKLCLYVEK